MAQLVLDEKNAPALFDGDCLKVTAYRFYSPNGVTNDTMGVLPTLLISQENTEAAARLLRADVPGIADGSLKLELAGHTFYLDDRKARHVDNRAAFTELLEALPPSAHLSVGYSGSTWTEVAPKELAQQWGLEFHSRTFSDTASSPFSQAIDTLAVYGLLSGYEDGTFHPGRPSPGRSSAPWWPPP
ncbi:MAG: S-layer homology domain-containing protein [Lawsonibacter sp.]